MSRSDPVGSPQEADEVGRMAEEAELLLTPPEVRVLPRVWVFFEENILLNLATAFMAGAMVVMFYEATSRSLLSESHWWAEELVRILVVWSVLLTLGTASRKHHFIRMDLLVRRLSSRWQRAAGFLNALVGLGFSTLLIVAGLREVQHLHFTGMLTDSNLYLPLWLVRLAMPVGGMLYALYFLGNLYALLRGHDPNQEIIT
ncbi:TRAP transporter small permease [Algihabitans albus]|uniref:TRAP transporter small permease n=1 Tax=Algihabitans albus TaxID=2164067 RepID=UPI0013C29F6A|nr:TRAP transporter small permease [Algihabitans albus]